MAVLLLHNPTSSSFCSFFFAQTFSLRPALRSTFPVSQMKPGHNSLYIFPPLRDLEGRFSLLIVFYYSTSVFFISTTCFYNFYQMRLKIRPTCQGNHQCLQHRLDRLCHQQCLNIPIRLFRNHKSCAFGTNNPNHNFALLCVNFYLKLDHEALSQIRDKKLSSSMCGEDVAYFFAFFLLKK